MASSTETSSRLPEAVVGDVERPLSWRSIASGIGGGVAGVVAMLPVVVGVPVALGLFRLEGPQLFSTIVGGQPGAALGVAVFLAGGVVVVPLFFLVTATYLPPVRPAFARGITISSVTWSGFVVAFWPSGGLGVLGAFLVCTLVGHWVYGAVLGTTVHVLTGIPRHEV
jgi:hypothetical protein